MAGPLLRIGIAPSHLARPRHRRLPGQQSKGTNGTSIAEAERFAKDLDSNKSLLDEVIKRATGMNSVVEVAKSHGYDVTVEESRQCMESRSPKELTDGQLDAVAGA